MWVSAAEFRQILRARDARPYGLDTIVILRKIRRDSPCGCPVFFGKIQPCSGVGEMSPFLIIRFEHIGKFYAERSVYL